MAGALDFLTAADVSSSDGDYESSSSENSDVNTYGLAFAEIKEEGIEEESQDRKRQRKDKTDAFCDVCFMHNLIALSKNVAFYLCYLCDKYLCDKCFKLKCPKGNESHKIINLGSKESERDGQIERFLDEMMNETKREKMLETENVSMVDRVNVKHKLDKKDCCIYGLCGLDATRWVICDYYNYCIKIFSVGSNILQRYIRCGSQPWGVTEITVKQEPTEQVVMSASGSSDIYLTNKAEPDKQCLLAVTLRSLRSIVFIDVTQNPAVKTKSIETNNRLFSIEFSDDKMFILCCDDGYPCPCWFVSVMSTDGVTLKSLNTDLHTWSVPYLAVCPGRVYITDWDNNKVFCMNDEGIVVSNKTIDRSRPYGISVDQDTHTVYLCACFNHKLYRLDFSLESCESLFDFRSLNLMEPGALCFYRDKLYVGHDWRSTYENFINVVRVL